MVHWSSTLVALAEDPGLIAAHSHLYSQFWGIQYVPKTQAYIQAKHPDT